MSKTLSKYTALALSALLVFQLCDYLAVLSGKETLNSQYIFGLIGTNTVAIAISLVALFLLWSIFSKYRNLHLPLLVISAATISNILDRIFYGGVVDYIELWSWPSFNLADLAIVVALIYAVIVIVQKK